MRVRIALLILATLCSAGQESQTFRSEVNLVNITAVVRSADGKLVPNLNQDDFQVIEDGVPQEIRFFAREARLPLSLGLIVDTSGSQAKFLKQHKRDVETFLKMVLRPSDQAFAVCFGNHLHLVSDATSSGATILEGLERFQHDERGFPEIGPPEERDLGTALYDAIYFSIQKKLQAAGERRRALVVFSDGEENSSEHDLLDVIEAAQNSDTLVYCIRYTQKEHGKLNARNRYGMRVMQHMASLSGAADFDALSTRLDSVFAQISDELRATYQIGYVSTNLQPHDNSFRKVVIRCKQPGSVVRYKSGYYAR